MLIIKKKVHTTHTKHTIVQPSSAAYVLNVRLYTYRNEEHKDSNGFCCESYSRKRCKNNCDNIFTFCLRDVNIRDDNVGNCPLGKTEFSIYSDEINFHRNSILSFYSRQPWPVSENFSLFCMAEYVILKFTSNAGLSYAVCENY